MNSSVFTKALQKLKLNNINLLFIENVGNLICPAEFPLGSDKRVVVVSVTEGPYMVVKHPFIFMEADVVAINKKDLAEAMNVDVKKLEKDVKMINPKAAVVATNCRTGEAGWSNPEAVYGSDYQGLLFKQKRSGDGMAEGF